jgi:hypothetical protein
MLHIKTLTVLILVHPDRVHTRTHKHTIHQHWAQYELYTMEGVFSAITGYTVNKLPSFFITQKHTTYLKLHNVTAQTATLKISTDNIADILSTENFGISFSEFHS